ncbi:hypothetical protein SETIT_3G000300v2 [Setaria italica]|uniref:Uncharacterized protein n=1 Tax=Setaria italica TaxID=4555 RepID=A0A368Q9U0_SETIT|nr:hypothetical protein SETIT_3G000300v2 [Setaria italica]
MQGKSREVYNKGRAVPGQRPRRRCCPRKQAGYLRYKGRALMVGKTDCIILSYGRISKSPTCYFILTYGPCSAARLLTYGRCFFFNLCMLLHSLPNMAMDTSC